MPLGGVVCDAADWARGLDCDGQRYRAGHIGHVSAQPMRRRMASGVELVTRLAGDNTRVAADYANVGSSTDQPGCECQ